MAGNPAMMVDPWGLDDKTYEYAPGFVGPRSQPQEGDTRGSGSRQQAFIDGSWARVAVSRPVTVKASDAPASDNNPLMIPIIPEIRYQWGTPLSMQDYDQGYIKGLPQGYYAPAPAWMIGTLQIAGGMAGLALAAGVEWGTLGLGTFLAAGLVVYSADQLATGITTVATGKVQPTLLHKGVATGLTAAGVSPNIADRLATGTEIAAGIVLTAGTAALTSARLPATSGSALASPKSNATSGAIADASASIDPYSVRFSQASISPKFRTGESIDELADALRSGTIKPNEIPPIRLVKRDGILYTLDNRRLEAFRRAEVNIPYRMATGAEVAGESWKFTTSNGGVTIQVRGK